MLHHPATWWWPARLHAVLLMSSGHWYSKCRNGAFQPFRHIYTNKATRQQLMIQIASNPDRHGLTVSSAAFNSTARSLKSSIITRHVNMHACYFTLGHQRIRQAHAPHVNETGHSPWQGIDAFGLSPWQGLNIIYIYMDIIMSCKVFSLSSWNCLLSQTFEYYYA
jgi:hypothetical protein